MDEQQAAYWAGVIIGALVMGSLCGLVPLIMGLSKGQTGLAIGGFFACVVSGFVLGLLLAGPMAILFAILIARSPRLKGSS